MTGRAKSVRRARDQRRAPLRGFIVTWDVDSRDARTSSRLRRFVYGSRVERRGRQYVYPGFVERPDVRYLGQSVLFVPPREIQALRAAFRALGVEHVVTPAALGARSRR